MIPWQDCVQIYAYNFSNSAIHHLFDPNTKYQSGTFTPMCIQMFVSTFSNLFHFFLIWENVVEYKKVEHILVIIVNSKHILEMYFFIYKQ